MEYELGTKLDAIQSNQVLLDKKLQVILEKVAPEKIKTEPKE